MPYLNIRVGDSTYNALVNYCRSNNISIEQGCIKALENMCCLKRHSLVYNYGFTKDNVSSEEFLDHLVYCFERFGGPLSRRYNMLQNSKYVIYYMKMLSTTNATEMVSFNDCIGLLEATAQRTGKEPLLAFYYRNSSTKKVVFAVFGLSGVPEWYGKQLGPKYSIVRRTDCNKVFVHVKTGEDIRNVLMLSKGTLPSGLYNAIYGL